MRYFRNVYVRMMVLATVLLSFPADASARPGDCRTVDFYPDTVSVLDNPLDGWVLYLGRNWDADFWETQGYDNVKVSGQDTAVRVSDYAGTAYLRTSWTSMEPEEGKYFWTDPDSRLYRLVKSVMDRGLKMAFRIVVDGRDQGLNTPQFVFDAGAGYYLENEKFPDRKTPYPQDPVFRKYYEKFIEAFAKEFNDPDKVAFIDGYGLGKWGEGHNVVYEPGNAVTEKTAGYKSETMAWITSLYARCFTEIPLVINYHRHIGHPVSEGRQAEPDSEHLLQIAIGNGYCLRSDAFGMNNQDWGYNDWERNFVKKWAYRLPVIMEGGWIVGQHSWWNDPAGYKIPRDVRIGEFITSEEAKVNMMDFRSGKETLSWFQDAFDYVKKFVAEGGYRLYPESVSVPVSVGKGRQVRIMHRWANIGWGYCPNNIPQWNYRYKVAFALLDKSGEPVSVYVDSVSDPSGWIKGSPVSYEFDFCLGDVMPGDYTWAAAIVDTSRGNRPGIELAVDRSLVTDGGWVRISPVRIR